MTEEAQEPQVSNNEPNEQETNTPDLSAYFKEGEAGVFDPEKVAGLAKDLENQKKSTSYFQSQFMKKNGVPETAEGYYTHFKADSTYEEALKDETIKNNVDDFFKWCKDNNIGEREALLFIDHNLKGLSQFMMTEEQEQAEQERIYNEELAKAQPMLDNLGRTLEENNAIIENFLNSPSIFTNNPEMKEWITNLADTDAMGYKFVTLLTQAVEHRGVPVVTGSVEVKDKAALMKEYQNEKDPVLREAMMKKYLGEDK